MVSGKNTQVVASSVRRRVAESHVLNNSFHLTVPRPLFVEEFGLKRWMESTAIPSLALDRTTFEAGQWEDHILVAYSRGKEIKDELRRQDELVVDESAGGIIVGEIMKFLDEWQGYED